MSPRASCATAEPASRLIACEKSLMAFCSSPLNFQAQPRKLSAMACQRAGTRVGYRCNAVMRQTPRVSDLARAARPVDGAPERTMFMPKSILATVGLVVFLSSSTAMAVEVPKTSSVLDDLVGDALKRY